MTEPPLVALKDVPPVPDEPRGVVEVWPPNSRDHYRGRRIEVWWQTGPGSWFFTRAEGPNVTISKRDLRERSKDPKLWVISVEEYAVPLPGARRRPSPNRGARPDTGEGTESATASLVGTKPADTATTGPNPR